MSSRGQEAEGFACRHVVLLEPQQGPLHQDSFCSVWSRKSHTVVNSDSRVETTSDEEQRADDEEQRAQQTQKRIRLFKCYALHFTKKQANIFNIKCFNSHFSVKQWPHYRPNTTKAVNTGWLVIGTQYGGQGGRRCAGPAGCLSCSSLTLWFTRASSVRWPAVIRARDPAALNLHKTELKSGFPFICWAHSSWSNWRERVPEWEY